MSGPRMSINLAWAEERNICSSDESRRSMRSKGGWEDEEDDTGVAEGAEELSLLPLLVPAAEDEAEEGAGGSTGVKRLLRKCRFWSSREYSRHTTVRAVDAAVDASSPFSLSCSSCCAC